jgi:hypothetical protein
VFAGAFDGVFAGVLAGAGADAIWPPAPAAATVDWPVSPPPPPAASDNAARAEIATLEYRRGIPVLLMFMSLSYELVLNCCGAAHMHHMLLCKHKIHRM